MSISGDNGDVYVVNAFKMLLNKHYDLEYKGFQSARSINDDDILITGMLALLNPL